MMKILSDGEILGALVIIVCVLTPFLVAKWIDSHRR